MRGFNIFLADGEAAGQEVSHVHLHVFPRFKGGWVQAEPWMALLITNKPKREELDVVAKQLRTVLEKAKTHQSV